MLSQRRLGPLRIENMNVTCVLGGEVNREAIGEEAPPRKRASRQIGPPALRAGVSVAKTRAFPTRTAPVRLHVQMARVPSGRGPGAAAPAGRPPAPTTSPPSGPRRPSGNSPAAPGGPLPRTWTCPRDWTSASTGESVSQRSIVRDLPLSSGDEIRIHFARKRV